MQINENLIRAHAYEIWEAEGKPDGCAEKHWDMACESLNSEISQISQTSEICEPELNSQQRFDEEKHTENFIPHQNTKKGKHAHQPHSH